MKFVMRILHFLESLCDRRSLPLYSVQKTSSIKPVSVLNSVPAQCTSTIFYYLNTISDLRETIISSSCQTPFKISQSWFVAFRGNILTFRKFSATDFPFFLFESLADVGSISSSCRTVGGVCLHQDRKWHQSIAGHSHWPQLRLMMMSTRASRCAVWLSSGVKASDWTTA